MSGPGPMAEALGRLAFGFRQIQPFIPTYIHLLLSSLFPIFAGAHSSLSRPSSAAKPEKRQKKDGDKDEDQDEEAEIQKMEGLSPSDAIIFPLMAGGTLTGLYYLIKWLQDPAILNKILGYYFMIFGLLSVAQFSTDSFLTIHHFFFPRTWTSSAGIVYKVDSEHRLAYPDKEGHKSVKARTSPLPGFLSFKLPTKINKVLWDLRDTAEQKYRLQLYVRNAARAKVYFTDYHVNGLLFALLAVAYQTFVDKPWWLTNLFGFAFSYNALQLMSPTTFPTGTLILGALFFYDIYFVFYTSMMVTVATKLDVPIKLLFPRPADEADKGRPALAMLGLGDVVLPGIMIGLALRFDLYMHYLRKQTKQQIAEPSDKAEGAAEAKQQVFKAKYVSPANQWGARFWTSKLRPFSLPSATPRLADLVTFRKTYFYAGITGYVIGMLATLGVMHVFHHAQPALLYLVPGVLGALWSTALVRGEIKEMWNYNEASLEDEDATNKQREEAEKDRKLSLFSFSKHEKKAEALKKKAEEKEKSKDGDSNSKDKEEKDAKEDKKASSKKDTSNILISFTLRAPTPRSKPSTSTAATARPKTERKPSIQDQLNEAVTDQIGDTHHHHREGAIARNESSDSFGSDESIEVVASPTWKDEDVGVASGVGEPAGKRRRVA